MSSARMTTGLIFIFQLHPLIHIFTLFLAFILVCSCLQPGFGEISRFLFCLFEESQGKDCMCLETNNLTVCLCLLNGIWVHSPFFSIIFKREALFVTSCLFPW